MKFIPHRNVAQGPQIETVKKTRTETNYSTERNDELGNIFIAPIMRVWLVQETASNGGYKP